MRLPKTQPRALLVVAAAVFASGLGIIFIEHFSAPSSTTYNLSLLMRTAFWASALTYLGLRIYKKIRRE